jgi:hypothetical protein
VFGASLHRELELLGRCGITPAQALNAATAAPARVFNLADRGHTAPGQRADLMLVSGDPLTDITATRTIERIWRAGVLCDRRAFVANAAEAEELDAFDARVAKVVAAVRERRYGFDPCAAAQQVARPQPLQLVIREQPCRQPPTHPPHDPYRRANGTNRSGPDHNHPQNPHQCRSGISVLARRQRGESIRAIAAGVKVSIGVVHKTLTDAQPGTQRRPAGQAAGGTCV